VVYALTVNREDPVRLARASGRGHVAIRINQQYWVIRAEGERGPLKVETRSYMYTLEEAHGREILGYHWHPEGVSPFTMPHLHLGTGAKVGLPELDDAHLPTGRISVEQFLRFVIETFDVKARRRDWRRILRPPSQVRHFANEPCVSCRCSGRRVDGARGAVRRGRPSGGLRGQRAPAWASATWRGAAGRRADAWSAWDSCGLCGRSVAARPRERCALGRLPRARATAAHGRDPGTLETSTSRAHPF